METHHITPSFLNNNCITLLQATGWTPVIKNTHGGSNFSDGQGWFLTRFNKNKKLNKSRLAAKEAKLFVKHDLNNQMCLMK